jgi:replication factor C subunit 3/5
MVLELNASDDRGIDTVRDKIKEFASANLLLQGQGGLKLVILDEADSMTRTAQFALRRVMEQYTRTTRFVIIANYANKIIPALQSRCTSFRFAPLDPAALRAHLADVATREQLPCTPEGLDSVVRLSRGDMRNCLNLMQACQAAYGRVEQPGVYLCTGAPDPADVQAVLDVLMTKSCVDATDALHQLQRSKGLSLVDLSQALHASLLRASMPDRALAFLLPRLADIERALTVGAGEALQVSALVGAFVVARQIMVNAQ